MILDNLYINNEISNENNSNENDLDENNSIKNNSNENNSIKNNSNEDILNKNNSNVYSLDEESSDEKSSDEDDSTEDSSDKNNLNEETNYTDLSSYTKYSGKFDENDLTIFSNFGIQLHNFGFNWNAVDNTTLNAWSGIAISSSGQYQLASNCISGIFLSSDYGESFNKISSYLLDDIAISSSGQYQYGISHDTFYKSENCGNTWICSSILDDGLKSISTSSSGQYISILNENLIYLSSDYGNTFFSLSLGGTKISMSSNGQYQTVVNDYIYVSSDFGYTWSQKNIINLCSSVCISSSGQYQTVVVPPSLSKQNCVYISNDYGSSWILISSMLSTISTLPTNNIIYSDISISASGQYQTIICKNHYAFVSIDYGQNWVIEINSPNANSNKNAISSSGQYQTIILFYNMENLPIYTSKSDFLDTNSNFSFNSNLNVGKTINSANVISDTLLVLGVTDINKNLNVAQNINADTLNINKITSNSLNIKNDATFNGNIYCNKIINNLPASITYITNKCNLYL